MRISRQTSVLVCLCLALVAQRLDAQCTYTLSAQTTDVSCFGANDGFIDLSVSGGVGPFVYSWPDGQTTEDAVDLAPGTYIVTVTDGLGCISNLAREVKEPSAVSVSVNSATINCLNPSVDLHAVAQGGVGGYSYFWSNGPVGPDISVNSPGTYTVTVVDANGCSQSNSTTVNANLALPVADAGSIQTLNCQTASVQIGGAGSSSGPNFTYFWTGPGITLGNVLEQYPVVSLTGLYTLIVTNVINGCTASDIVFVNGTAPPIANAGPDMGLPCGGGQITLDGAGSSQGVKYTYYWQGLGPAFIVAGASTQNPVINTAGLYVLQVTDINTGCEKKDTVKVFPGPIVSASDIDILDVSCTGQLGAVFYGPTEGTPPYNYQWSDGSTDQSLIEVAPGLYSLTVTDGTGCSRYGEYTIGQGIPKYTVDFVAVDPTCPIGLDGSINLSISGFTWPPVTFIWSNGATSEDVGGLTAGTYKVTVTDGSACSTILSITLGGPTVFALSGVVTGNTGCAVPNGSIDLTVTPAGIYSYLWMTGAGTQDISGLVGGTYTVTVTNAFSCSKTATFVVGSAPPLSISGVATDASCDGNCDGKVQVTVSGGTPPFEYNWSPGDTGQTISSKCSGVYTVTVYDAGNCSATKSFTINSQPSGMTLDIVSFNASCSGFDGAVDLTVTGGTFPYTYLWSNFHSIQDCAGLTAGTYTVTVTDATGCTKTASAVVGQNSLVNLSVSTTPSQCFPACSGSIDLTVTNGAPPYIYLWSMGATSQDINGFLCSGTYTVTVTDASGCTKTISAVVGSNSPINLTTNKSNVRCFGGADGWIDLTTTGGATPYTFLWNTGATTEDITNLSVGIYTVTVTDQNNCTKTTSVTISQPTTISITGSVLNASCSGMQNGSIDISVSGGVPPYTYIWSPNVTTQDLSGLSAGAYTVTVTDANFCTQTKDFVVGMSSPIDLSIVKNDAPCFGSSNGWADLTVTGGAPAYTYSWSNGAATEDLNNLPAGSYTVTVTDANLCTQTASVTIGQPTSITITANLINVSCFGGTNGAIDLTVSGGTPAYTYHWNNNATIQDLSALSAGTYTVTVTDFHGCTQTKSATITQAAQLVLTFQTQAETCNGQGNGAINLTVTGGTPSYTYQWNTNPTVQDINNLVAGIYTVTVTDIAGCTKSGSATIMAPTPITFSIVSVDNTCSSETLTGPVNPNFLYQWSGPGGFQANSTQITVYTSGVYTLTVTDAFGCTATQNYSVNLLGNASCGAIKGRVFHDTDESCNYNAAEPGLAGWIVQAVSSTDTVYDVTDAQGRYLLPVPLGTYTLRTFVPNSLWNICPGGAPVTLSIIGDTIAGGDFAVQSLYKCPALTVDLGTKRLRRCSLDNSYEVEYRNLGTQTATNAYVTVSLDPYLTLMSASLPYVDLGANTYQVNVGDLSIGECGTFTMQVFVGCNAVLGQTHCSSASIYPDSVCSPPNALWSGASLQVKSFCDNDSLRFTIKNAGTATMTTAANYIVVEDGIMFRQSVLPPLTKGDSMNLSFPANGSTWRVEVKQEPNHPYASRVGLSVEGCSLNATSFSTGFVNQFPLSDEFPALDIDCRANTNSFDPNDKQGYPVGYGTEHFIRPGTDIAYQIRFQNTGTDTAFRVEIIDTLSAWLDPASISFGVSSHPYRYDMDGNGIVHFIFENIELPDSNVNEPASHGYVKFAIKHIADAPLGARIENTAGIYFDQNDPVYTNTTFHILAENFITVGLWEPQKPEIRIEVSPNPFAESTRLSLNGLEENLPLRLQIFDLHGRMLQEMKGDKSGFELKKGDWQPGIYGFRVMAEGRLIGSGKLVVE